MASGQSLIASHPPLYSFTFPVPHTLAFTFELQRILLYRLPRCRVHTFATHCEHGGRSVDLTLSDSCSRCCSATFGIVQVVYTCPGGRLTLLVVVRSDRATLVTHLVAFAHARFVPIRTRITVALPYIRAPTFVPTLHPPVLHTTVVM